MEAKLSGSDVGLFLVPTGHGGVVWNDLSAVDQSTRQYEMSLDGVALENDARIATGAQAVELLLDEWRAALATESLGACQRMLEMTVAYAKDRVQFGSPIGRFQGVKHPLAEGFVDIESMKSLLYYAAWALDASPEEVPFSASKAKGFASEAFTRIGVTGIQLHGAVGYTEEYDIQLYLKRSNWARPMYGDEDYHYDRVASFGGI